MKEMYKCCGGPLGVNSYILTANGTECLIVDCCDGALLKRYLANKNLICRALLLTHAHFDHCGEAALLQRDGVKIYMHESDTALLEGDGNLAAAMGGAFLPFKPDVLVSDGDELEFVGLSVKVIHTPGHTAGGVCYIVDDEALFSGDTLFCMGMGRTDFPSGDFSVLRRSIREKLFALPKNYTVYPGHGEKTSLDYERRFNPYV